MQSNPLRSALPTLIRPSLDAVGLSVGINFFMYVGICPLYIDAVRQLALGSSTDLTLFPLGSPAQLLAR